MTLLNPVAMAITFSFQHMMSRCHSSDTIVMLLVCKNVVLFMCVFVVQVSYFLSLIIIIFALKCKNPHAGEKPDAGMDDVGNWEDVEIWEYVE